MLIRTLRLCSVQGRECRAYACLDLPAAEAEAMIDAGDAERWIPGQPPGAAPTPAEPAVEAPADQEA